MSRLDETVVIVLAAGQGRRMGGPKALMRVGNELWWRRQKRTLDSLGMRQVWVISAQVEEVVGADRDAPVERLLADGRAPQFESLLIGVRSAAARQPQGIFVLPVDVPCPQQEVWRGLVATGEPAVPVYEGKRGHPPYLPWRWVEMMILASTPGEPRRLDELLRDRTIEVETSDPLVTLNLNKPTDLQRFMALGGEQGDAEQ